MQDVKTQLDWSAFTFSNPWYTVLYALLPWLPGARKVNASIKAVRQVSLPLVTGNQLSDTLSLFCTVTLRTALQLCVTSACYPLLPFRHMCDPIEDHAR